MSKVPRIYLYIFIYPSVLQDSAYCPGPELNPVGPGASSPYRELPGASTYELPNTTLPRKYLLGGGGGGDHRNPNLLVNREAAAAREDSFLAKSKKISHKDLFSARESPLIGEDKVERNVTSTSKE